MQHNARRIMYDATAHNACCADLQQAEVINSAGLVIGHPENALPPQRPQMALTSGVRPSHRLLVWWNKWLQRHKYKGKGKDQQSLSVWLQSSKFYLEYTLSTFNVQA